MTCLSRPLPKRLAASLFGLAIVLVPRVSPALTVEDVPNPRQVYGGWVTDMANVIDDNTEAKLDRLISTLEAKNGSEIAVVTVEETAPAPTPKAFATELFNHWGIGKRGVDNGILFLVSVGDRRVEIETGYGLAQILPDAEVKNILDDQIIPKLKRDDFDGGVLAGTRALVSGLETVDFDEPAGDRRTSSDKNNILSALLVLACGGLGIAGILFIGMIQDGGGGRGGGGGGSRKPRGSSSHASVGSYGGSCGGGGGGGGFGGGGSGGGGAGGSF